MRQRIKTQPQTAQKRDRKRLGALPRYLYATLYAQGPIHAYKTMDEATLRRKSGQRIVRYEITALRVPVDIGFELNE